MAVMDIIYSFLKTILDFLVQIVMLFISMLVYILHFIGSLVQGVAQSV